MFYQTEFSKSGVSSDSDSEVVCSIPRIKQRSNMNWALLNTNKVWSSVFSSKIVGNCICLTKGITSDTVEL